MVFKNKVVVTPENGLLISIKGPISIDHVYSQIQQWFGRYKYDFTEKEHTEKNKPQGNELLIKWIADRKIDDYMQYYVEIDFLITELRKVGNNYHAKTKINLRGYVKLDYRDFFQETPRKRFLFYLYNNIIIKRKIMKHKMKLYKEVMDIHDLLKALLEHYR